MNPSRTPSVRFKGYEDEWEERKLGELAKSFEYGLNASAKEFDGYHKYIRITDIDDCTHEFIQNKLTSPDVDFTNADNYILQRGDILFARTGASVGKSYYYKENDGLVYFAGFLIRARIKPEVSPKFVFQNTLTSKYNEFITITSQRSGQPGVNAEEYSNFKMMVPSFEEQEKIGTFFKQLDDTIALHQRKLNLLNEQKKGFLQKMFPKNGEKIPEIRFAGFNDDWEERKLGELSNIVGGGTPSTSNPEYWDGDIDWYAPAEIGEQSYVSKSKKTITELGLKKSSARILPVGTVLFTSRAGIGNTAILGKEATTNQGFQSIVPDQNKLDSYFIYSRTNELKRYGEVTGAGSTFVEVSGKQMSKMSIMIPELSEQQKIGSFFKQLDNIIALHQRKIDELKSMKKSMLQKMFV